MNEGLFSAIGNTPLLRLNRIFRNDPFRVYAKLEATNPGGSIKDRTALSIIKGALESGDLHAGTTIIESSSGNMGIGLAQACAYLGLRFLCVVDPKTTIQNISILEAYGAEVDCVLEPDPATGEFLQARLKRVRELLDSIPDSFWPNQYANPLNASAHHQTMREIAVELDFRVDYLFCATSTCGTLRGCAEYVKEAELGTKLVAVDAVGSVIFGGQPAKRLIPGHGATIRPPLFQPDLSDMCVHASDQDCVVGCRRLVREEAILAGGSSGAVLMALDRIKQQIPYGSNCVLIFPDRGERYLDTIYSDEWVTTHFGDISHLWKNVKEQQLCMTTTY